MSELLQEFVDSGSQRLRVDRDGGRDSRRQAAGSRVAQRPALSRGRARRGDRPVRRREGQHQSPEGPSAFAARLSGPAGRGARRAVSRRRRAVRRLAFQSRSTRFRSSSCGTPSTRRKTSACRTTCWPARRAAATRRSSRRSPRCRASTWWPTRPRRAGCMSSRRVESRASRVRARARQASRLCLARLDVAHARAASTASAGLDCAKSSSAYESQLDAVAQRSSMKLIAQEEASRRRERIAAAAAGARPAAADGRRRRRFAPRQPAVHRNADARGRRRRSAAARSKSGPRLVRSACEWRNGRQRERSRGRDRAIKLRSQQRAGGRASTAQEFAAAIRGS